MMYRHGDLLINSVDKIPTGVKKFSSGKLNKLALGETTGHAHTLVTDVDVEVYELDGVKYFELPVEGELTHEEHKTITIEPDIYKVLVEREFDYVSKEIEKVRD